MASIEKKAPSGRVFHSAEGHNIKRPHREMCLVRLLLLDVERQIGWLFYAVADVDGEGLALRFKKNIMLRCLLSNNGCNFLMRLACL